MKKEISQKLQTNKILSGLTISIGTILLLYMVIVEDEPGALPLFLILAGTVWFFINHHQIKKSLL
jgi:hypothetical protein